jgi:hypothetical protein
MLELKPSIHLAGRRVEQKRLTPLVDRKLEQLVELATFQAVQLAQRRQVILLLMVGPEVHQVLAVCQLIMMQLAAHRRAVLCRALWKLLIRFRQADW